MDASERIIYDIKVCKRHIKQIERNLEEGHERQKQGKYKPGQWDIIRKDGKRALSDAKKRLKNLNRKKRG